MDRNDDAWEVHERSQLEYFRSLSLMQRLTAVEGMAETFRHFEKMRRDGKFHHADKHPDA